MSDPSKFAAVVGHQFRNSALVREAVTHSTLVNEREGQGRTPNDRLAHLGDAVVELAVRSALFARFPDWDKEQLTDAKKELVNGDALAAVAKTIGLDALLERGRSRPDAPAVWSEAFEAAMGAVFLDSNYETAARIVLNHVPIPTSF